MTSLEWFAMIMVNKKGDNICRKVCSHLESICRKACSHLAGTKINIWAVFLYCEASNNDNNKQHNNKYNMAKMHSKATTTHHKLALASTHKTCWPHHVAYSNPILHKHSPCQSAPQKTTYTHLNTQTNTLTHTHTHAHSQKEVIFSEAAQQKWS